MRKKKSLIKSLGTLIKFQCLVTDEFTSFSVQALDLVPKKIHERSPIFLGSYDDVEEIKALFYAAEEKKE